MYDYDIDWHYKSSSASWSLINQNQLMKHSGCSVNMNLRSIDPCLDGGQTRTNDLKASRGQPYMESI